MEDYQRKVITEKEELDKKIINLQKFVENENADSIYNRLPQAEKRDLNDQLRVMFAYSQLLQSRINRF